jgi:ABC-2 type transport system permease protein
METEAEEQEFIRANNEVPSSFDQIRIQTKYEFLNYLRSKRFYILLGIVAAIGLLIMAAIASIRPTDYLSSNLAFYHVWWGSIVGLVVILGGIFFGGDAISGEFQNKTGYYLLPNPLRRSAIYFGKYVAAYLACAIMVGVFAIITIADGALYFGSSIPYQFAESFLFELIYIAPILGVTFLFSSVFKNNSYSILVSAILLIFGFGTIATELASLAQIEPWFSLNYGGSIAGNVLNPGGYPTRNIVIANVKTFAATIPEGLAIMLIYFAVTTVLGLVLFERKDFN